MLQKSFRLFLILPGWHATRSPSLYPLPARHLPHCWQYHLTSDAVGFPLQFLPRSFRLCPLHKGHLHDNRRFPQALSFSVDISSPLPPMPRSDIPQAVTVNHDRDLKAENSYFRSCNRWSLHRPFHWSYKCPSGQSFHADASVLLRLRRTVPRLNDLLLKRPAHSLPGGIFHALPVPAVSQWCDGRHASSVRS